MGPIKPSNLAELLDRFDRLRAIQLRLDHIEHYAVTKGDYKELHGKIFAKQHELITQMVNMEAK